MIRSPPVLLLLLLLLPAPSLLGSPSFLDYSSSWDECEDGACWDRTTYLEVQQTVSLTNSSLKVSFFCLIFYSPSPTLTPLLQVLKEDYVEITTRSLVEQCAPGVALGQLAWSFDSCKDITDKYVYIPYTFLAVVRV